MISLVRHFSNFVTRAEDIRRTCNSELTVKCTITAENASYNIVVCLMYASFALLEIISLCLEQPLSVEKCGGEGGTLPLVRRGEFTGGAMYFRLG